MMPIDEFIHQLIQLGLADSFLDVIKNHYIKISEIYNLISFIDTNNIINMDCESGIDPESITLILNLYNPVDDIIIEDTEELTIQVNNKGNIVEITVVNNYESEEEIYEARFSEHGNINQGKWS